MKKTKTKKIEKRLKKIDFITLGIFLILTTTTFANGSGLDVSGELKGILKSVSTAIKLIGGASIAWGIIQLGISIKSEDPTTRPKAMLTIAAGSLIAYAGTFLGTVTT